MGQKYIGTLVVQTSDYYSPVGSYVLEPLNEPATAKDVVPGKELYGQDGELINGLFVDGWPIELSTEEEVDEFITAENVGRYVKYVSLNPSSKGDAPYPINPIQIGDTITQLYYNEAVQPDLSLLDWSNAETSSSDTRVLLIGQEASPKIYATKEAAFGDIVGDIYSIIRTDNNSPLWISENARETYHIPEGGWVANNFKNYNFIVNAVEQQDIWGAYISKDEQWAGVSKYISGQVYKVVQNGGVIELREIQY